MGIRSRIGRWLGTLALLAMTLIFASVSIRFLFDTAGNGAYLGMLPSPTNPSLGIISIRVGYGVYTLSFVIVGLYTLLTSQLRPGVVFVAVIMALLLGVRIISGLNGGAMAENPFILVGETVMLVLAATSLLLGFETSKSGEAKVAQERVQ